MRRRTFLQVAGLGSAAAVAGCSQASPGGPPTTSPTGGGPTVAPTVPPPDWGGLRERLGGALRQVGEEGYDVQRRSFNPLFDRHSPTAVATVSSVDQVKACVDLARRSELAIAARGGGHSYAGYSVPDGGLVVDLRGLSAVEVRPDGSAVVGAGARLIDVYAALATAGRAIPAGTCPTVGIAGLTLGGGIGVLSRKYGLTCDKLTSAEVVIADGTTRTASGDVEPDLFWALRGGGGGNFGIVTSFTFATDPAPDVTVFMMSFPAGSAADVVGAWQEWAAQGPDELWSNAVITGGSPPTCRVSGCFVGSPTVLKPMLDRLVARAGVRPKSRTAQPQSYLDAMRYFAGCSRRPIAQCTPDTLPRETFVASSRIVQDPIGDPAALSALVDGRLDMDILLDVLGGAVSRIKPEDTAFPHRTALASAQIYQKTTVPQQEAASRAVAEVRDGLARLGARGGYVNYIERAMPSWGVMYYGVNVSRLHSVARRYDPDAVFAFPQSVHRA
ncbi:MAG: FAD-dependent oxidoreductase [Actinomycetota bacterium]|nr:FAD-dependent oxidoreductase [Actinomycetota bacterium]